MTKTVKALENSHVLMKGVTKTLKNDMKKGGTLPLIPMLLGNLGATLWAGRVLFRAGQGMYRTGSRGKGLFRAGQGTYRAGSRGKGLFRTGQGI